MAWNASTFPHVVPYSTDAQVVRFAPIQDSEAGDDMLEPPFVRIRDGNTAYMYIDTSPETQFRSTSNDASWIVGAADPRGKSHIDGRKIKRQAVVAIKYMWATPNVNPTNNTFTFRISGFPTIDVTASIPTYNYLRMFTSPVSQQPYPLIPSVSPFVAYTTLLTTAAPGIGNEVDPRDGILTKLAEAMNAALFAAGSGITMHVVASDGYQDIPTSNYNNTNVLFWRLAPSAGTFIFTGGSLFERGRFLLGLDAIDPATDFTNLANYYAVYSGGPVSYLYTRWIDITSRTLLQNTKMPLSGTDVPSTLLVRVYLGKENQAHGTTFVEIENVPLQWINWRTDQAINSVDLQMRDEFGQLVEMPQRQNNSSWLSVVLLNEL